MEMTSDEIRETFLQFFQKYDHRRIPGASLIPANDPTLLFVNSGMAPLKPYFTGQEKPPYPRLCNVQPCLRTTDIEDVGDRHHLTLFEMLGSWSIGDYFKQRAIELAYELLTEGFKLDPDRLYVTIFAGDSSLDLAPDEESARHWEAMGIKRDRIIPLGFEDNFWGPAGDTGPCGPCTEVFYDSGPEYGEPYVPGGLFDSSRRYIEIWNAGVFMQFDKQRGGSFVPLPFASVDTGSGLERLTMTLNRQSTVYDTDLLAPIVQAVQEVLEEPGEVQEQHRLIADHLRAATFVLAEGVHPANEGRGYVPRRLIRKSMTVARRAGVEELDVAAVADAVIHRMAPHYPRLGERRDDVLRLLDEERREFARAMQRGLDRVQGLLEAGHRISGREAFHLFSTYGLPFEITRDLSAERGLAVDEAGFREEFHRHQETSRGDTKTAATRRLSRTDPLSDLPIPGPDQFVGYGRLVAESPIVGMFVDGEPITQASEGDEVEILAERTPFYAEGGGQVGDRGRIMTATGVIEVDDTERHGTGYHVHRGRVTSGAVASGERATLEVDAAARIATQANHSATHLLNAALRAVLGPHVRQAGSLVEPARLRFDFTHDAPLSREQLREVERLVNDQVLANHRRDVQVLPPQQAAASGALFLPGEDYGQAVRVVSFDGFSREFCGGTHVDGTAEVGLFRIVSEQSIAAGTRRMTAVTREAALELTLDRDDLLYDVAAQLKTNLVGVGERVRQLLQSARGGTRSAGADAVSLTDLVTTKTPGGIPVAVTRTGEKDGVRKAAARAAERLDAVVCVLATSDGRSTVVVAVPGSLHDDLDARRILNALLAEAGGTGGGSASLAQGGASGPGLDSLLDRVPAILDQQRKTAPS